MVWITKDGTRIPIPELKDSHLINILRLLKRNATLRLAANEAILLNACPNGDAAWEGVRMEMDKVWEASWRDAVVPEFRALESEASKRGLVWDNQTMIEELTFRTKAALVLAGIN